MDKKEFDEFKEFQEYQEWKKNKKNRESPIKYRPSPLLQKRWGRILCACLITATIITAIVLGIKQCATNNSTTQNNNTDNIQNEQPLEPSNNHEFIEIQESIIGTWEYYCDEQSLIEFGRPESEYNLSKVNFALNKYIENIGFTPSDERNGLTDERYFIDRAQLRQGIIGQKFFFGADNSLHIAILFQSDFQIYPSQQAYYYDENFNLVEGKIGEAITVPNELSQYEIINGYELVNNKQNGIMLQTFSVTFENMKLIDNNTLQLEYLRPGDSEKVVLTFTRAL